MSELLSYRLPTVSLTLHISEPENYVRVKIKTPSDISEFLKPLMRSHNEQFIIVLLNARHEVMGLNVVSVGTLTNSLVHMREVFKTALIANAYAIIAAHNHPSGSELLASPEDIETTKSLIRAGGMLGIPIVDHIIVSPQGNSISIREEYPQIWESARAAAAVSEPAETYVASKISPDVRSFIVDVWTNDKNRILQRLRRLKSTVSVSDGGIYHQDPMFSQVHLETTMTETELDTWLWESNAGDYVGIVETTRAQAEE